jgi:transposase
MEMPWKAQRPQYARRLAVEMAENGVSVQEVAELFGVAERSVWRWRRAFRAGGEGALATASRMGRPPKITREVAVKLLGWLNRSACDFGFVNDRWTARRLVCVLERESGILLNHRYLSDWLSRHEITPQMPQRVPRERDESNVAAWISGQWPLLKKKWLGGARRLVLPTKAASF